MNQQPQFQQNFVAQTTQNFTAAAPITTQINPQTTFGGNLSQDPSTLQYKGSTFQYQQTPASQTRHSPKKPQNTDK